MQVMPKRKYSFTLLVGLLAVMLSPLVASAQSQLSTSAAQAFLGNWNLAIQTEQGVFNLDLDIVDQGGKVAANLGSPEMGVSQTVTDITRSGDNLVLRYAMNAQGQPAPPISLTLTPNGNELNALVSVAEGAFTATGIATKKSAG
ncbi:MAG: hypothetical protein EXR92_00070 [Gemmatimonadetes bacterium]|nr:hypothetical protein [Gemmatimonadota bacterium]